MARLIYAALASLDGSVADEDGRFDWAEPDAEVHAFVNDLERSLGTYLYGRRMYEVMVWWETLDLADLPPHIRDYAEVWRDADKIVYSRTLPTVSSERTRLEREFDPDAVRRLKAVRGPRPRDRRPGARGPRPRRRAGRRGAPAPGRRTWWAAGLGCSPTASSFRSSCWTSAGSATAPCTSAIASPRDLGAEDGHRQRRRALRPDVRVAGEPCAPADRRRGDVDGLVGGRVSASASRRARAS